MSQGIVTFFISDKVDSCTFLTLDLFWTGSLLKLAPVALRSGCKWFDFIGLS